jgi:hypothetical protein
LDPGHNNGMDRSHKACEDKTEEGGPAAAPPLPAHFERPKYTTFRALIQGLLSNRANRTKLKKYTIFRALIGTLYSSTRVAHKTGSGLSLFERAIIVKILLRAKSNEIHNDPRNYFYRAKLKRAFQFLFSGCANCSRACCRNMPKQENCTGAAVQQCLTNCSIGRQVYPLSYQLHTCNTTARYLPRCQHDHVIAVVTSGQRATMTRGLC